MATSRPPYAVMALSVSRVRRLPLLLCAPLLGVDPRPAGVAAGALFVLSLLLAVSVGLALEFIFGALVVALEQGVWVVSQVRVALTTILSGALKIDLALFIASAIVARGARFFALAWLLRRYGAPIQEFIEKRLGLIASGVAAAIILLYVAARLA